MTNAEAIEMIQNDMKLHHDYLSGEYRKALKKAIKALGSQQKWIPCNPSELPKDKKLLVTHYNHGCRYVDDVYWDMTEWSDNVADVVAYMPYVEPEPYREDEE